MALNPGLEDTAPRLARGLESLRRWGDAALHFAPIRHHSPGCATAVANLLDEVRPSVVLIEGPREYSALLPALADEGTRPPVAVLSIHDGRTACYPLADFSPEWVALQWAAAHAAEVDFIDQSWADQPDEDDPGAGIRTLQAELHLARSETIAALAARLGCRDHDEVWEHLFELRGSDQMTDWRGYHADVLAWAALARLETTRELLDADGTHAREAVMAAMIARHRESAKGPIVVVTGAFHTLALLEALDGTVEGQWVTARDPGPLDVPRPAWLIRYDHTRLDGLRGYGAGMPAPGFWQRAWDSREPARSRMQSSRLSGVEEPSQEHDDAREFTVQILLDVATTLRASGELLSTAEVTEAAEQALRLARFRNRARPGLTDLTDAMLSCFVRDDSGLSGPLGDAIAKVFGGAALGDLPPGLASPPLVAEARSQAEKLRFVVRDGATREVSLDTSRKPAHVKRREFLATMRFVGSGFARQVGGADLVAGTGLEQLAERWEYAWTPLVETALVEVSAEGGTLAEVRAGRVRQRLALDNLDAAAAATLIAELVVMGAQADLPPVLVALRTCYDDARLDSAVASLHTLTGLLTEAGRLALGEEHTRLRRAPASPLVRPSRLSGVDAETEPSVQGDYHGTTVRDLLESGVAAVAYQLGPLADVRPEDAGDACRTLLSLRALLRRLAEPDLAGQVDTTAPRRELHQLRERREAAARVHGCLVGIAHSDGELDPSGLRAEVTAHLHPGADPDRVSAFLLGLMEAEPDLIVHDPELLAAVSARLGDLSEEDLLRMLPDLRQAFTWLRPTETARLAELVAEATGVQATDVDVVLNIDPALATRAQTVELDLLTSLQRDGLEADYARRFASQHPQSARPHTQAGGRSPQSGVAEPNQTANRELARRWRLVLGRYADRRLPNAATDAELDATLGYLYDREYTARGHRHVKGRGGSLDPSALTALNWLGKAGRLFPASTLERMERDAITRYGIGELLADSSAAEHIEASPDLAKALLRARGKLDANTAAGVRRIIARAVADILARLRLTFTTSLTGSRLRHQRSSRASLRNFDWRRTIAANLANVDPKTGRMLVEDVQFMARQRRRNLQWQVIIVVDQSGSMAGSVLHSAVSAAILAGLPGISVRLILFDTSVVDVSHLAADPVEVLMTAQLGGGTDIARAMSYAAKQVQQPSRTVLALISDFDEGGSVSSLLATVRGLAGSGVRLLGLASLADEGEPWYDHAMAARLAAAGMQIAAMTPDRFAEWLAEVTQ